MVAYVVLASTFRVIRIALEDGPPSSPPNGLLLPTTTTTTTTTSSNVKNHRWNNASSAILSIPTTAITTTSASSLTTERLLQHQQQEAERLVVIVLIAMGNVTQTNYTERCLWSLQHIGHWQGTVVVITDQPSHYSHLSVVVDNKVDDHKNKNHKIIVAPAKAEHLRPRHNTTTYVRYKSRYTNGSKHLYWTMSKSIIIILYHHHH
jgi:hypothetical protein